jgi:hypothetical protein
MNMTASDVVATFSRNTLTSKILRLQENGKRMKLDNGGWVPGLGSSGVDPNDAVGEKITVPPSPYDQGQCLTDTLQTLNNLRGLHAKAIAAIDAYIVQAKVNKQGSTPPSATSQKFSGRKIVFR